VFWRVYGTGGGGYFMGKTRWKGRGWWGGFKGEIRSRGSGGKKDCGVR